MLTRIALRIAVQEALRGRTLAGDNVLDSSIGALDLDADGSARTDQDKPFLSVYTDSGAMAAGNGLMGLFAESTVELVIEAGTTAAMVEQDPETGAGIVLGLGLPATDAGIELTVDMMLREAADALTDPGNQWADLVRCLFVNVTAIERSRTGQVTNGTRLAAHELRIKGEMVQDPARGADLTGSDYERFLAALAATGRPDLLAVKDSFERVLVGLPLDWELVQRELGQTNGQSIALGLRPLATDDAGAEPELGDVSIEIAGRQDGQP